MVKPNKTNKETTTFLEGCNEVNKFLFYRHVNVDCSSHYAIFNILHVYAWDRCVYVFL